MAPVLTLHQGGRRKPASTIRAERKAAEARAIRAVAAALAEQAQTIRGKSQVKDDMVKWGDNLEQWCKEKEA